jgi:apolipoprotein N-acyltransferase
MAGLAFLLDEPARTLAQPGRLRRASLGAARGLAFGVGANVVALRFVPDVIARFTPLPWALGCLALVLLACEQGVRWAVAAMVHVQLSRRGVPSWLAFGTGIFTGTFVPAVFPWSAAGGVTPVPAMVQLAELVGERGVTLLMALSAGLLSSGIRLALEVRAAKRQGEASEAGASRRAWLLSGSALLLPGLMFGYGSLRMRHVEAERAMAPTARVGLIEPSTQALERWDPTQSQAILDRLSNLTRTAEREGAELTVWPEAAYPIPVAHGSRYCPIGARAMLPMGVRGPVLAGMVMTGGNGDLWNSAALCRSDGTMSRPYDKSRLLAFGESIPLVGGIPWVRQTFSRGAGLVAGKTSVLQVSGSIRASVLNCFEDTLPDAGRDAMLDRPNLLVNITNDAWFVGSGESELHLRLGVLRAVESRRDFVRAVNLGPTTWVDAAGVVRGRYEGPLAGLLVATPALLEGGPTLFDQLGDFPTALGLLLLAIIRMTRRSA